MSCMSFSCGTKAREQAGAQTSHPYETVGCTTESKRRLIMGKDLSHIRVLCLTDKRAAAPLPVLQQPGQSLCHAARLMKDNAQVLEGCRPRENMLPNMPCVRAAAIEDNNLCLGRADGEPKLKQKACMLSRRSCSPAAVQDSKTTSSAYTRADTHLPEPNCNPACGKLQSRWPCKPSKKMPNKVGLRGQPCRTPFCWTREGPAAPPTFMERVPLAYRDLMAANIFGPRQCPPVEPRASHAAPCHKPSADRQMTQTAAPLQYGSVDEVTQGEEVMNG